MKHERFVVISAVVLALMAPVLKADANLFTLETFKLDRRKIRYVDQGSGSPVLLLHAFACDHTDWRFVIQALAKRYRVIVPDLAFFGKSDSGPLPHTTVNHAKDCMTLLGHLGIQEVIIVGHSMGGFVARDMYLAAPQRVRAIVEVDNTAMIPALSELPNLLKVHRPTGAEYQSELNLKRRSRYLENKARLREVFHSNNPKPFHQPSPKGKWCSVPVLVIYTSRGAFSRQDVSDDWVRDKSPSEKSRLVVISDSAHWVMLEQPEQFIDALMNFMLGL